MKGEKRYLINIIEPDDTEKFVQTLKVFAKGGRLDKKTCGHILSMTLGKAGADMNRNITSVKTKRIRGRFIGMAAAAAIMVTGAVGAGAAYVIGKRSTSDIYFGESSQELLESTGAKSSDIIKTVKCRHFDVDIETMIFDGKCLTVTASAVPYDEEGEELINDGREPFLHTPLSTVSEKTLKTEDGDDMYEAEYDEEISYFYENGREVIRLTYTLDKPQDRVTIPLTLLVDSEKGTGFESLGDFELEFVRNSDVYIFENDRGEQIHMSANSVTANNVTIETAQDPLPLREAEVQLKDGNTEKIKVYSCTDEEPDENGCYKNVEITFNDYLDIDDVSSITIGATRFERKG